MNTVVYDLETDGHHIEYINHIARYASMRGDKITIITSKRGGIHIQQSNIENVDIECINKINSKDVNILDRLGKKVKQYKSIEKCFDVAKSRSADVVQIMYLDVNIIPLLLVLLKKGSIKQSVFALLVVPYILHNKKDKSILKKIYHKVKKGALTYMIKSTLLDGLYVLRNETKRKLCNSSKHIHKRDIKVIPDPIEKFTGNIGEREAKNRIGVPFDKPVFMFFGIITEEKGVDLLLEAATYIKDENLVILIAGENRCIKESKIKEAKEKIDENVKIVEKLKYISEKKEEYFTAADFVVLPYKKSYVGSSGVLQQAAGTMSPVIATDVGQIGDIVRESEIGEVLPPNDPLSLANCISNISKNKAKQKRFKENCKEYAKKHDWKRMAKKVVKFHEKVI